MQEIVTIQLGQRANYVATHYWNTQEAYQTFPPEPPSPVNHDISFRTGIGADGGETYMPRTVIYDLKGGFGSLKRVNELYELEADREGRGGVWNGPTIIQTAPIIPPSPYISSLSASTNPSRPTISTVKYWSDFSHIYFHPRSVVQLNDYSLGSSLQPFENYTSGDELFDGLDKEHDLLDRDLRLWAEECDHMQGVQVFTGADDAWGGFAARYVERIRDEFGKVGIWVWGIEGGQGEDKQLLRTTNSARALHDISAHSSLYIPLSNIPQRLPNYVVVDRKSEWHTSALLATAIESMTLPCRLRGDDRTHPTFDSFEAALNVNGNQRIARLQASVLDPQVLEDRLKKEAKLGGHDRRAPTATRSHMLLDEEDHREPRGDGQDPDIDLLPGETRPLPYQSMKSPKPAHVFGRVDSVRGPFKEGDSQERNEDEGFSGKRRRATGMPVAERYHSSLQYELLETFPNIFETVSAKKSVAVRARLSTTTGVANRVKVLQAVVGRMIGLDEREALSNGLGEIAEAYEEGWSSGSDDSSDD
ncbi:mtDNA inheritance, partitioning of the mitochondrial organelle [Trapelia coarctata]|nr:mtDNA inheritance, partitioning of the mitochondrial organelle [Trapelia coarctata]